MEKLNVSLNVKSLSSCNIDDLIYLPNLYTKVMLFVLPFSSERIVIVMDQFPPN